MQTDMEAYYRRVNFKVEIIGIDDLSDDGLICILDVCDLPRTNIMNSDVNVYWVTAHDVVHTRCSSNLIPDRKLDVD